MIFRNRAYDNDKKIKPLTGLLLFLVSIVLLSLTVVFGLVYGFIYTFIKKGSQGVGEYALKMAISIDQLGNVSMQHLLNKLWLKENAYRFGNRDETISSALGRNKNLNLLNGFGRSVDRMLDYLDPKHSLNSIDYYVQPSEQITTRVAWICIEKGRILCIRYKNEPIYHIPEGLSELSETDTISLSQHMERMLSVELKPESFLPVGIFEGKSRTPDESPLVQLRCYQAEYTGQLFPRQEITEIVWLHYKEKKLVAGADKLVFDYLQEKDLLK